MATTPKAQRRAAKRRQLATRRAIRTYATMQGAARP